ncbi:hypothetical protein HY945_05530 [Candidatus Gottesmanbacteria bacterium]|nr:hypothetical protein [Candidatus Gottesmanbacteria bacterium]
MDNKKKGKSKAAKDLSGVKNNKDFLWYLFLLVLQNKKWWLLPFLFLLAIFGLFVSLTSNQAILPAIYAIF